MPIKPHGLLGQLFHNGVMARWKSAVSAARHTPRTILRAQRYQARQLRSLMQEFCHLADDRLALPHIGSNSFARPAGTDWSWRPDFWRLPLVPSGQAPVLDKTRFGAEIGIFHNCPQSEIAVRQIRNSHETDISPYAFQMDVFHFDGSYLSIVVDMPKAGCENLRKKHVIKLTAIIEVEQPITVFARLNIKNGPNTEQILLTLSNVSGEATVEYDLADTQLNEKRTEHMWCDLIFENPGMNRITLRDLTVSRYPRAEF